MPRFEDWPNRLNLAIEGARARKFEWGTFDCCLFAAGCVDAMTGTNIVSQWQGLYDTEAGAQALLEQKGGLEAVLNGMFDSVSCPFAGRGDVIMLNLTGSPLGIVETSGKRVAAMGSDGLVIVTRSLAVKAWKVA